MADPPDQDAVGRVVDLVDDAPVADSNAVALVGRELLRAGRTPIARERVEAADDPIEEDGRLSSQRVT